MQIWIDVSSRVVMIERRKHTKGTTTRTKQRTSKSIPGKNRGKRDRAGSQGIVLYGVQACRAVFEYRRNAINRVCFLAGSRPRFEDIIAWCEKNRRPVKEVRQPELTKIAGGEHHEGIVFDIKPKPTVSLKTLLDEGAGKSSQCLVVLEGVQNPHNIGAIVRTCCFFGVEGVVVIGSDSPHLSSATYRIAEGALEQTTVIMESNVEDVVPELERAGYELYATSPHEATSLYTVQWPKKVALFFGAERDGLSPQLLATIANRIVIPRKGALESLNVGAAVASVLTEVSRGFTV